MPTYEMECPACNDSGGKATRFEVRQGYNDRAMVRCPKCKTPARRLISVVNHTFGFRLTDRCHERFGPKEEMERAV